MNTKLRATMFSSATSEWGTPQSLFDALNKKYQFTLDACATEENFKVSNYYTVEKDGLSQPWNGRVYCNPPYGRTIGKWVKKAYESACLTVMLLPARTDTRWFHDFIYHNDNAKIQFLRGRLKFNDGKNPAPFPSMIVVFNSPCLSVLDKTNIV